MAEAGARCPVTLPAHKSYITSAISPFFSYITSLFVSLHSGITPESEMNCGSANFWGPEITCSVCLPRVQVACMAASVKLMASPAPLLFMTIYVFSPLIRLSPIYRRRCHLSLLLTMIK
eukprot:3500255-Pleurochrysis_carterae.AAC.3